MRTIDQDFNMFSWRVALDKSEGVVKSIVVLGDA
jgi:hypothetical protein